MKLPETFTLFVGPDDEDGSECRYFYDAGEPAKWYGPLMSDGAPATAYVTECLIDGEWVPSSRIAEKTFDNLNDQLWQRLEDYV